MREHTKMFLDALAFAPIVGGAAILLTWGIVLLVLELGLWGALILWGLFAIGWIGHRHDTNWA